MNSNLILKSDVLDIIFEKRNKAYGAYTLRKLYPSRLKLALGIMMITAAGFSALTLLPSKKNELPVREHFFEENRMAEVKTEQVKPARPPEPPKAETKATPASEVKFTSNMQIFKDNLADTLRNIKETDVIGGTTVIISDPGPITVPPAVPALPGVSGTEPPKVDRTTPVGLDAVDVPPSFPGGTEALLNFLRRHLNNPEPMTKDESVSVRVTFVVGYEGKLQGFRITQDGGDVFNKEVIRVLKKMPDWVPGKAKGENVSVYYSIPVKFTGTD